MINVGVIGIGYWGQNIVRNFYSNPKTSVQFWCDLRQERLQYIRNMYPNIEGTTNYKEIVNNSDLDLVAICTPFFTR